MLLNLIRTQTCVRYPPGFACRRQHMDHSLVLDLLAQGKVKAAKDAFENNPTDLHGVTQLIPALAKREKNIHASFAAYRKCVEHTDPDAVLLSSLLETCRNEKKGVREAVELVWRDLRKFQITPTLPLLTAILQASSSSVYLE
eukprot:TRINITY_DN6237_c0_g1_i2.p1 TRINITY_DN6237_c0_g1~~TRINITY_DN6237_c0_g1_i2.p1  ORF type:complete len:143 (-),score=23.61 TRINITY_DN6237_c0_g1_i2:96-524(-)